MDDSQLLTRIDRGKRKRAIPNTNKVTNIPFIQGPREETIFSSQSQNDEQEEDLNDSKMLERLSSHEEITAGNFILDPADTAKYSTNKPTANTSSGVPVSSKVRKRHKSWYKENTTSSKD